MISPLLANLCINRFLKHWRLRGCEKRFRAKLIKDTADFVIFKPPAMRRKPWRGPGA